MNRTRQDIANYMRSGKPALTVNSGFIRSERQQADRKIHIVGRKNAIFTAIVAAMSAFSPIGVNAQENAATPNNSGGFTIEEIIVLAQKRSEDLQDVPLSITAFTSEALDIQRIQSIQDIAAATPNFTYSSFAGNRPEFTIRGIGTAGVVRAGLDNAVVMFLDEVYISRASASAFELFDLEQVSVLRGPQGTLFGKNVVGGAVSITTKRPNIEKFEGKVKLGVGNEGYTELKALVSGPISDSIAGKLSISKQDRDGYGRDLLSGQELDDLDTGSLRGQLLFMGNGTELLVSADYAEDESNGKTLSDTPRSNRFEESLDDDPRTSNHGVEQGIEGEQWGVSAKLDWELESGTVTALTAYRDSSTELREAFTAATVPEFGGLGSALDIFEQEEEADQFSFEARYATESAGALNWVAGVFYLQEDITRLECEIAVTDTDAGFVPPFFHGGVSDSSHSCWDQNVETDGWAVFWDGTMDLSETVTVRVGARYSSDSKDSTTVATAVVPASVPGRQISAFLNEEFDVSVEDDFSGFTPRGVIEWRVVDEAMLYLSVSRGYKAGGFDGKTSNPTAATAGFDNEYALTYELGWKSAFLNNSIQFNAAIFQTDFEDLQQLILTSTGSLAVVNAGEATIKGFEAELTWVPTDSLYLTAGYGYLDAEYDEFVIAPFGSVLDDRSGNMLPNAPENKANINATYDLALANDASMQFQGSVQWTDEYFNDSNNNPSTLVESYAVYNGSVNYISPSEAFTVSLWGKNLGDEEYENRRFSFLGTSAVHLAPPRTYGVSVTWDL